MPPTSSSDVTILDFGVWSPQLPNGVAEALAVLGPLDHVERRADQLDSRAPPAARRSASSRARLSAGLPAHRREQGVGPLAAEHVGDALEVERLDVRAVGEPGVGHDRRRVRVDDDRAEAVLAQHLERLRARVVELARLPDHDRAGADQSRSTSGHAAGARRTSSTQSLMIGHASCGPGPASGWNCTERARRSGKSRPSTVPS